MINIVIMGKTGAGKSTIVNAVMEAEVAPTGLGSRGNKENIIYARPIELTRNSMVYHYCKLKIKTSLNLYDTVGLELDKEITKKTLEQIRGYIEKSQKVSGDRDINLVWFCVNSRSNKLEPYEIDLIKDLSNEYEIPFVMALTQCIFEDEGELEKCIKTELPEVSLIRILAKDYKIRSGVIPAFGIKELLETSIFDYDKLKVQILESKLERLADSRSQRIAELKDRADYCIQKHVKYAYDAGKIPVACIPVVHVICMTMLHELDKVVHIHTTKGFENEIFDNIARGFRYTPKMAVPGKSADAARRYVERTGNSYRDALFNVMEKSSDNDLKNIDLISKRIVEELRTKF